MKKLERLGSISLLGFSLDPLFSEESLEKVGSRETCRCHKQFNLVFNHGSSDHLTSHSSAHISSNCSLIRHSVNSISNTRELKSICKATEQIYSTRIEIELHGLMSF